ncbi:MAG: hypothetical protein WAO98_00360 [Alphaproteobacteria bacterium]
MSEQISKDKKQDDGNTTKVGHDCSCNHMVARLPTKVEGLASEAPQVFCIADNAYLASITVGPLFEPPSRA